MMLYTTLWIITLSTWEINQATHTYKLGGNFIIFWDLLKFLKIYKKNWKRLKKNISGEDRESNSTMSGQRVRKTLHSPSFTEEWPACLPLLQLSLSWFWLSPSQFQNPSPHQSITFKFQHNTHVNTIPSFPRSIDDFADAGIEAYLVEKFR